MKISPPRKRYHCLCKWISIPSLILKYRVDHLSRGTQQRPSLPDSRLAYQITQVTNHRTQKSRPRKRTWNLSLLLDQSQTAISGEVWNNNLTCNCFPQLIRNSIPRRAALLGSRSKTGPDGTTLWKANLSTPIATSSLPPKHLKRYTSNCFPQFLRNGLSVPHPVLGMFSL